jgi:hypothetical protein
MSHTQKLQQLQKEIQLIYSHKKKKRLKPHQKIMIDFINGATKKAIFQIQSQKVILFMGDEKKGFIHILKHYKANDLEALDILNIAEVIERGMLLANEGVSNDAMKVYRHLKGIKDLRLILKKSKDGDWIVSFYKKG